MLHADRLWCLGLVRVLAIVVNGELSTEEVRADLAQEASRFLVDFFLVHTYHVV